MARNTRKIFHDEDTRKRIQVGNIINRLQKHIDGEIELTTTQVASAKLLLDKALPNLTSVEVNTEETKTYVLRAPLPAKSTDEWLKEFGPKTIEHLPTKGKA